MAFRKTKLHISAFIVNNSLCFTAVIYTTIGVLSSKFYEFLAVRSQFDSDHGVDIYAPTC